MSIQKNDSGQNHSVNPNPYDVMMKLILGKWIGKAIYVAAKLKLADIVNEKSISISALAKITKTHPEALYRLMRALSSIGIFHEKEDRIFNQTPLSETLQSGKLRDSALVFQSDWHDAAWNNLYHSIKTGSSAFENVYDKTFFEWLGDNPTEQTVVSGALSSNAQMKNHTIAQLYDFSLFKSVVDVGGGTGGFVIELMRLFPNIKCAVVDQPHVIDHTNRILKMNRLDNQCETYGADFFQMIPVQSDLFVLMHVLHDWGDDESIKILKNCREQLNKNGHILVIEFIVPDMNIPSPAKLMDLEMLVMSSCGKERTLEEYDHLFKKSGLEIAKVFNTKAGISIIDITAQ